MWQKKINKKTKQMSTNLSLLQREKTVFILRLKRLLTVRRDTSY